MVAAQAELKAKAESIREIKAEEIPAETSGGRVVLQGISWKTYESFLADYENHAGPRFYYDNGTMEIKMPSFKHEEENRTLMLLIELLAIELGIDLRRFGSATFKRDDLLKGFEPDSCFYLQNAEAISGKASPDLTLDPPPDLLIEVDVASGSMDKFSLFAALGVPEIWRCENERLMIYRLENGRYAESERSLALPLLTSEQATRFLSESREMKSSAWARHVRQWVSEQVDAQQQPQD